jgi:outer membrane protein TolC
MNYTEKALELLAAAEVNSRSTARRSEAELQIKIANAYFNLRRADDTETFYAEIVDILERKQFK